MPLRPSMTLTRGCPVARVWYTRSTTQRRSSKQGPKDLNGIAFRIAGEATAEAGPAQPREKNPAAVQLGRAGGLARIMLGEHYPGPGPRIIHDPRE